MTSSLFVDWAWAEKERRGQESSGRWGCCKGLALQCIWKTSVLQPEGPNYYYKTTSGENYVMLNIRGYNTAVWRYVTVECYKHCFMKECNKWVKCCFLTWERESSSHCVILYDKDKLTELTVWAKCCKKNWGITFMSILSSETQMKFCMICLEWFILQLNTHAFIIKWHAPTHTLNRQPECEVISARGQRMWFSLGFLPISA